MIGRRRGAWAVLCALLTVSLSGCWDIATPEPLTIPVLLAVDWVHGRYQVTVESDVPQLMHSPGASSGSGAERPTWVFQGTGSSVTEALRRTGLDFPNRNPLTFAHLRVVVISPAVLRSPGWPGLVDRLMRAPYLHRTFWVLVSRSQAMPFAETTNPVGPDPVEVLNQTLKAAEHDGWAYPVRMYQIAEHWLNQPAEAAVLPVLALRPEPGVASGSDFSVVGAAVVTPLGLAGEWSRRETETYGLLAGRAPSLLLSLKDGGRRYVLQTVSSHFHIALAAGRLTVAGQVAVTLDEVDGTGPLLSASAIQRRAAEVLAHDALALVRWSQAHRLDLFACYPKALATRPFSAAPNPKTWTAALARAPVTVTVAVTLRDTGSLNPQA
ncbi:MAG: spore gernimation protein GerC [Firmicutes bacterium]|nr:spore gernimation protein GerC [Alicyclobacillaceae bacterium]MCL6497278.1 spore gernimation protein GerC [Bacillota bacterium]